MTPVSDGKPVWKSLLSAAICLTIGICFGLAWSNWHAAGDGCRQGRHGGARSLERRLARYSSELNLDAEQRKAVREIFIDSRKALKEMRKEVRPRYLEIREAARGRIRQVLNPDQTAKFEAMEARKKRWYQKRRERRDREEQEFSSGD